MDTTDDRWVRADRILDQALDLPPEERPSFLAGACGEDGELRALVERLLAGAEATSALAPGGALQGAVWRRMAGDGEDDELAAGGVVGRYRILRELGRGGMAVVYLAERADGQFEQQVALKLLKRGLDTDEIVQRFEQERRILAGARHPGIARLLDGGAGPGGRPYLVMEYVEGRPLDRYCDEERLSVPDRLRLFLQVARAVADAHRNLVVHRDIKPSNILVTADGHARLLDFGIAKLLDPESAGGIVPVTRTVARLMTPAFASPEQIEGEPVTTASDIYQLGLLLFLLLAGRFPHQSTRPSAAATGPAERGVPPGQEPRTPDAIARARATSPKRLRRALAGDLDTIVLTALRREPERRYGSVAQLIEDVERHLAGRPVSARPDTLTYRAGKYLRRHAAAAVVAVSALALVVTLTVAYTLELAEERDRARLAALQATQVSGFLRGLFEVSAPTRSQGEEVTARRLLDQGAARIDAELAGQPEIQADLMTLIGDVYRELALYEEAKALLSRAVDLRRQHPGPDRLGLAAALHAAGRVFTETADHARARRSFAEALALREKALGPDHPDVARTLTAFGRLLTLEGKFRDARLRQERAVSILEASLGSRHPEVGLALRDLGLTLVRSVEAVSAKALLERSLGILEASFGPDHPHVAELRMQLGDTLAAMGDRETARRHYELALPVLERIYGADHPVLAEALDTLADLLIAPGLAAKDPDGAIAYLERALAIRQAALSPGHPLVATTLNGLGRAYRLKKDFPTARRYLEQSLRLKEAAFGPDHTDLADILATLAGVYEQMAEPVLALRTYERALRIRERVFGRDHQTLTLVLFSMARLRRAMGEPGACETLLRRTLAINASEGPEADHALGMLRIELGTCLLDQKRFSEAEEHFRPFTGEELDPETRKRALEGLARLDAAQER